MNKLISVKLKSIPDDHADTDWIGEYTDRPEPWAICRHCGEYLHNAERYDRIVDTIENYIDDINYGCDLDREPEMEKVLRALESAQRKFEAKQHDCQHNYREYNYFKPYAGGEKEGSKAYQEHGLRDYERIEGLNNGSWHFIGICAEAIIEIKVGKACYHHKVESSGLWGTESDAGEDHFREVGTEQLVELYKMLAEMNVDLSQWDEMSGNCGLED